MNMRESALWKSFNKVIPSDAMAVRMENMLYSGMPDVLLTCRGKTILIELKAGLNISRTQADWARRWSNAGGTSWFLIAMGGNHYLVPGHLGVEILRHPTKVYDHRVDGVRDAVEKILR